MVGEASGRMQKADCRDEIALPAAMLAWLKYRKQRTRNSRKRFLVFFCSLFVKARVVYRLRCFYAKQKKEGVSPLFRGTVYLLVYTSSSSVILFECFIIGRFCITTQLPV